uniref:Uncharacterized protein n=1 Tax=Haptolina ericina TaxID=156174 RepID=A0A7S3FCV7_9EUKA
MKGEGGDEEIKLHGNRLVLAGQTAAVYCSTLCRRAHAKLKAPSRPVLLCPGPRQRLVEKCRRLPIWMRVIAALAACLLIKVLLPSSPSGVPASRSLAAPIATSQPQHGPNSPPTQATATQHAPAAKPPLSTSSAGGSVTVPGGSRVSTADLRAALSASQPPSHPAPPAEAAPEKSAGKPASKPAGKPAGKPGQAAAAAVPGPACKPASKFDTAFEKCDTSCLVTAKKFHCTLCKCKTCGFCVASVSNAGDGKAGSHAEQPRGKAQDAKGGAHGSKVPATQKF